MTAYRVEFERLGRGDPPAPAIYDDITDVDELAYYLHQVATPRLVSRNVSVVVDLDDSTVTVLAGGWRVVGKGTVTEVSDA